MTFLKNIIKRFFKAAVLLMYEIVSAAFPYPISRVVVFDECVKSALTRAADEEEGHGRKARKRKKERRA